MIRPIYAALPVVLLAGCSDYRETALPETFPVSGRILQASGAPVTWGVVTFNPMDRNGQEATAEIEPDGTFRMGTFGKDDGARPGRYRVTIDPRSYRAGGKGKIDPHNQIPKMYRSEETTPLEVEVRAQDNELPPWQLR